jgi:hypothetical protein
MHQGLKHHTHLERERVIDALVPPIIRHMGNQLVALGVAGPFAPVADGAYSDIEMIGFVKKHPGPRSVVRYVHDGMLIDLWFLTRQDYVDLHKSKIRANWPFTAVTALRPLINIAFIRELNAMPYNNSAQDRMRALGDFWPEIQDATARLLSAAAAGDQDPVPYLFWLTVEKICVALSLLNAQPFTARAAMFRETRGFALLPPSFGQLLAGQGAAPAELAQRVLRVFEEMEQLLSAEGVKLYARSLDEFVAEPTFTDLLRDSLQVDRFADRPAKPRRQIQTKLRDTLIGP